MSRNRGGVEMPDSARSQDVPGGNPVSANPVPLSVLTASGVRFDWHEATAVVQEVCALLSRSGTRAAKLLPDQQHVLFQPDGRLVLSSDISAAAKSAEEQVAALARLLLSLVPEGQLPVQLRLVALSAIAATPTLATAAAFSNALAYFERPGRPEILRSVYLRSQPQPAAPVPTGPPVPEEGTATKKRAATPPSLRRRRLAIVTAALVLVAAGGAAGWWFTGGAAAAPVVSATHTVTQVLSVGWRAARDLATAGVSAVRSRLENVSGSQSLPSQAGADQSEVKTPLSQSATAQASGKPAAAPVSAQPSPVALVPPQLPEALPTFHAFDLSASLLARPPGGERETAKAPVSQSETTRDAVTAAPVYSAADPDVEPPVPVKPKIATVLPADQREENLSVVDLVIAEDGQVDSVRLIRPARGVREAMMLSAVKAWQFRPALKAGRPVRYLKRIWISLSPIGTVER